jgi:hypothetical protein
MSEFEVVGRLRAKAEQCRQLADRASDSEAAEALQQIADDIEIALSVLQAELQETATCP